jgi:hypothetical protein
MRSVKNLHTFFDALSVLKRQEKPVDFPVNQQANWLTFGLMGERGVAIYLEGKHAGQIDD